MSEERLEILRMLEAGQIDADGAAALLAALEPTAEEVVGECTAPGRIPAEPPESSWARYWIYVAMAGGITLVIGALITTLVYATAAARGWLLCGWPPLLVGAAAVLLALWSRQATWMHLKVTNREAPDVNISFPLPLTLAAWIMRIAQPFIPSLRDTGVDDLIIALRDSAGSGEPFFIDVEDDQDGERVQLYFG